MKKNFAKLHGPRFLVATTCLCFFSVASAATPHAGMKLIHAAKDSFQMGFDKGVQNWACITGKHLVKFTYDFYVDSTMVTQGDYSTIMKYNPSGHTGNLQLPVEKVNWYDAVLYCNARSKRDNLDTVYSYTSMTKNGNTTTNLANLTFTSANLKKNGYRLLTNAEAEYCVRSHTTGMWWWTTTTNATQATTDAAAYVVWSGNDGGTTQPVASKKPNAFGLYDMTGNLFEWGNDWEAPYVTTTEIDPIGAPASNAPACTTWDAGPNLKMARGGSFKNDCNYHGRTPYHFKWGIADQSVEVGFRCAATVTGAPVGTNENAIFKPGFSGVMIIPGRLSTKIEYIMEYPGTVAITVVDCRGTIISKLVSGNQPVGRHTASWDGKNGFGIKVSAGSYIVSATMGQRSFSKAVVVTN
jgi:formylglycine-generating enzyme required for sulfatase activity